MLIGVGVKRTSIGIIAHLWVGTHVNGAIQSWLQKLDVESKLVLIGLSGCVIQIKMELTDVLLALWQTAFKQFASADDFHASARSTQKAHQSFRQFLGQLSYFYSLFVGLQVVHLQYYQSVIGQHAPIAFAILIVGHKTDAWQFDATLYLCGNLSVAQSVWIHQMIYLARLAHSILNHTILDG